GPEDSTSLSRTAVFLSQMNAMSASHFSQLHIIIDDQRCAKVLAQFQQLPGISQPLHLVAGFIPILDQTTSALERSGHTSGKRRARHELAVGNGIQRFYRGDIYHNYIAKKSVKKV